MHSPPRPRISNLVATARGTLAVRLGVPEVRLLDDPEHVADPSLRAALQAENALLLPRIAIRRSSPTMALPANRCD